VGCEVGFRYHNLAVFQIQLAKKVDAAPLTRSYLYSPEVHELL
jgi:cyclopropane-fatty-acyl-phospholipid synthase